MIKSIHVLIALIALTGIACSPALTNKIPSEFYEKSFIDYDLNFKANFEIAQYLYNYDLVAWGSSDSVSAQLDKNPSLADSLGAEWCCYKEGNNFHAVYGKYYKDTDKYSIVFHYILDNNYEIKRSDSRVDMNKALSFARAIHNSFSVVERFKDSSDIRLNWYVRNDSVGNIEVWCMPAIPSEGNIVYGGDFFYKFDTTGKVLIDSSWHHDHFYDIKERDIKETTSLVSNAFDYPAVGDMALSLNILRMYKQKCRMVIIYTKNYKSGIAKDKNGYSFIHSKRHTDSVDSNRSSLIKLNK